VALVYEALGGPSWTSCSHDPFVSSCEGSRWLSGDLECDWFGVTCDQNDAIVGIDLVENGLDGSLPEEIFALETLDTLTLDHNDIFGTISSSISNLAMLRVLNMDHNWLSGGIPEELYSLTRLEAIDLNDNTLSGTISSMIGNLSDLVVLQLEGNSFSGPVPSMTSLRKLSLLYLHDNNLSGSVEALCGLTGFYRGRNPAYLQFLSADCDLVSCSCCTQCF